VPVPQFNPDLPSYTFPTTPPVPFAKRPLNVRNSKPPPVVPISLRPLIAALAERRAAQPCFKDPRTEKASPTVETPLPSPTEPTQPETSAEEANNFWDQATSAITVSFRDSLTCI
jgi:hypothetical protein